MRAGSFAAILMGFGCGARSALLWDRDGGGSAEWDAGEVPDGGNAGGRRDAGARTDAGGDTDPGCGDPVERCAICEEPPGPSPDYS